MPAKENRHNVENNTCLQAESGFGSDLHYEENNIDHVNNPVRRQLEKIDQFFSKKIWLVKTQKLSLSKRIGYALLKIIYIVLKGIVRNKISLQASSLTFITLMSLVPLLSL